MKKIEYFTHSQNSIFSRMMIRENSEKAFINAINKGLSNPEDYMYMYSVNGKDYFKHIVTRKYISFSQN